MDNSKLIEPVFVGKVNMLKRAAKLLDQHDIKCWHSSPKRAFGILRVSRADAETARGLLPQLSSEFVVSAEEAAHFFCPECDALLEPGAIRCPECGEFVGDPHAM